MNTLCPRLNLTLLSNLLAHPGPQKENPAIDYLQEALAGQSPNDALADVLLCYARDAVTPEPRLLTARFREGVLIYWLESTGRKVMADAVDAAHLAWYRVPGRWTVDDSGQMVPAGDGYLQLKRAVLLCFDGVRRDGLKPVEFLTAAVGPDVGESRITS